MTDCQNFNLIELKLTELSVEDIIEIHQVIQKQYNVPQGSNSGLLYSIVERPSLNIYSHVPFQGVYSKCASIVESLIKWHPFIDGNKRTALTVARAYMVRNGYNMVIPLSAPRFSVLVAQDRKDLNQIVNWIRALSSKSQKAHEVKIKRYRIDPAAKLLDLYKSNNAPKADQLLNKWLAVDIYPEYKKGRKENLRMLKDIISRSDMNSTL